MVDQSSISRLKIIIESVLFAAGTPVPLSQLPHLTEASREEVNVAVAELTEECRARGTRIQNNGDSLQLVTAPEAAPYVERLLGRQKQHRLSPSILETLAIIAYRQPIGRSALEELRGVNCDYALAALKARGLISEVGRSGSIGRPYLYGTTFHFLEHFGLEKPEDLPPLAENEAKDDPTNSSDKHDSGPL